MSALELNRIGQIHIPVEDIEASVAFYRDLLGMEFLFQVPGQSMAFFNCGGVRLYLGTAEGSDRPSRPIIYYSVDAIDAACEALVETEVDLEDPPHVVHKTEETELWMASVEDPAGNLVCLMEERSLL